jgi:dihydroorotate dehydrogenase (subfamily 1) family protein
MKDVKPVTLGRKSIWPPFTIPSGIVTVNPDTIVRFAREVPIGMITTKSVGKTPFNGYPEPVVSLYSTDGISSAIGLSTMGYRAWVDEMKQVYPLKGKFLLVSVFGSTADDFVEVAKAVSQVADGIELNFCCPHSLEYGEAVAKQSDLTVEITRQVRNAVDLPIVVKLTPNVVDIGKWAESLVKAGADAIAAIGPTTAVTVRDEHTGEPVLSFGSGGLSGPAIVQRALECVRSIRAHVNVPIIASGGISTAEDVAAFREAGADIFSIGTSLAGMDTPQIKAYFEKMIEGLTSDKAGLTPRRTFDGLHLKHRPYRVMTVENSGDVAVVRFDESIDAEPGQFVFVWLPGIGEKPFSLAGNHPLVLGIQCVGKVSAALTTLRVGDTVMIRGPFGRPFSLGPNAVLVAGGCGAVPIRFLASKLEKPLIILGATRRERLLFADEFKTLGETVVMTDDGSEGGQGTTVDALQNLLAERGLENAVFYNCGPERMMAAAVDVELKYATRDRIVICVERHTCCGVGLCGKCSMDGYRTCVDGPCFTLDELAETTSFGRYHRGPSGQIEDPGRPHDGSADAGGSCLPGCEG